MSTIKSSAENLTLNADGANNDIKFQSNGSEVASIDQAGLVTASGVSLAAGGTLTTASGNDLNIVYPDSRSLFIKEAGTTHVAVDNTGNVGIGASSAGGKLEIHQEQVTGQFDRDCFLRLHPSAHTNSGGFTNMMFGTSTTNNYGVAIGGLRAGTDNAPSFRINMLNDSVSGFNALTIDPTGAVTMPLQPAFSVTAGGNSNIGLSTTTVNFNSEIFDQNSDFNTSTYKFTAPVTGKYQFNMSFRLDELDSGAGYYRLKFITSNRTYTSLIIDPNFTSDIDYYHMSGSYLADMDSGDTAEVAIQQNSGTSQTDVTSGADTHFSGYLVA